MTAGLETLNILSGDPGLYVSLERKSRRLAEGIARTIDSLGLPLTQNRVGSMSTLFFTPGRVIDYAGALKADTKRFGVYFREMLRRGIYLAPSQYEAGFMSVAHTDEDIDRTIDANREALTAAFTTK
jgi:glutamate-1-semialdehyde 2,1-aminomutase